jgi:transcriptional regulator with XRE-family HTH domain/tetratricopeptide (TPR) repeat protein
VSRDEASGEDTTIDRMRREFGARLRGLRTGAGLTLQGLAGRIESNTSSLSALEKGQGSRAPDRHLVTRFVDVCLAAASMDRAVKQELRTDLFDDQLALARAIEAGPDQPRARRAGQPNGQLVRDCDPRHLGVHKAIQVDGATADLPGYVERDVDSDRQGIRATLAEAGRRGGFVVLVGGSSVGKSRSAYEGIRALFPAWRLVHPDPDDAGWMQALTDRGAAEMVVWLDELQRYLDGPHPPTADGVRRALRAGGPVVFIGTLWSERYAAYVAPPVPGSIEDPWRRERELLALADALTVPASFSAEEQARAHSLALNDPQLSVALRHNVYGLTQTVAAAPQLIERWKNANVYAAAVFAAAIDAGRLGVQVPLPADFLRAAAPGYCTDQQRATAPSDWFAAALDYATRMLHGAAAALEPAAAGMGTVRGYTVADYLQQHAGKERRRARVPAATWRAVLHHVGNGDDLARCGHAAMSRMLFQHAMPLYRRSLAMGSLRGTVRLALLLARQGQLDAAVQVLSVAADAGNGPARVDLVRLLVEHGRLDELRSRADDGDDLAALHLASALSDAGRREEAVALLRGYLDAGRDVAGGLAELMDEQGTPQEAIDLLRDDARGGAHLASLFAKHGHEPELWARADAGDLFASLKVVELLTERGALEELRNRADQGDPYALFRAAMLVADRGRIDEAVALLRQLEAWPAPEEADPAVSTVRSFAMAYATYALGELSTRQLFDAVQAQQDRVDRMMAALERGDHPHGAPSPCRVHSSWNSRYASCSPN